MFRVESCDHPRYGPWDWRSWIPKMVMSKSTIRQGSAESCAVQWIVDPSHQAPCRQVMALMPPSIRGRKTGSPVERKLFLLTEMANRFQPWTPIERVMLNVALDTLALETCPLCTINIDVKHVGLLPDLVRVVGGVWFLNTSAPRKNALHHLLSKAIPQRCQFRNFRDLCKKYFQTNPILSDFVRSLVFLTLGGYYPHSVSFLDPTHRILLYQDLCGMSRERFLKWSLDNVMLVFYALKELLLFLLAFDPPLHTVALTEHRWGEFQRQTIAALQMVRRCWCNPTEPLPNNSIQIALHRHHSKNVRQLPKKHTASWFKQLADRVRKRRIRASPTVAEFVVGLQQHASLGTPTLFNEELADAMLRLHGSRTLLEWWEQRKHPNDTSIQELNELDRGCLCATIQRLEFLEEIRIVTLPQHIYLAQRRAVSDKFHIDYQNDEAIHTASNFFVCVICNKFKGFVVQNSDLNVYAHGHEKVAYDDELNEYFCSKHHTNKRSGLNPRRRDRRSHVMALTEDGSSSPSYPLVRVNLLGSLLLCYGKQYTLCCLCASPCPLKVDLLSSDGLLTCGFCQDETLDCDRCLFCERHTTHGRGWTRCFVYDEAARKTRDASLCPEHTVHSIHRRKLWFKDSLFQAIIQRGTERRT